MIKPLAKIFAAKRELALVFVPGAFFILMGIATLIAPNLLIGVLAGFFLFVGAMMCLLGWKVIRLRQSITKLARDFEGRVVIRGLDLAPREGAPRDQGPRFEEEAYIESKKIILH